MESPPTETTPVVGAKVEIVSGALQGRSATTDATGQYVLPDVVGSFDAVASRGGYTTASISVQAEETRRDLQLQPDEVEAQTTLRDRVCISSRYAHIPGGPIRCNGEPEQTHYFLPIHRAGTAMVSIDFEYVGDYYPSFLAFEMRCGAQLIAEVDAVTFSARLARISPGVRRTAYNFAQLPTFPIPVVLPGPCNYEIKLFDYVPDRKGNRDWTTYTMDIRHPK